MELGIFDDLEKISGVSIDEFEVTEELASNAAMKVGRVDAIFPYDPFEEHIATVRKNGRIATEAIETAMSLEIMPPGHNASTISKLLESAGYQLCSSRSILPEKEIIDKAASEWDKRRDQYIKMIRWRGVSDPL
ncbi:hypothetical protein [Methylococcus mesophilus]|uniref:hypothetical protein n=1 Tax=Methylococcus mesophilus TaxID=2993564 RepID=UPI00224B1F26|nr:hypothetical protein [Methylococcus mesophilus]UZR30644.1 hypothetical protein OOT43_08430 [Methylococcus mesophilus]